MKTILDDIAPFPTHPFPVKGILGHRANPMVHSPHLFAMDFSQTRIFDVEKGKVRRREKRRKSLMGRDHQPWPAHPPPKLAV
jgi:hypothetical protein